ncbi:MAG: zinc ribbon domain-containing protein [Lachnospiraceae bacterium]|nr:zinc ribbon domain-containing protein [Lachnospiraceae bacterium]
MNFEEIGKKVRKIGKDTVEEVQKMNEVRQLNGKVNDAKKQINNLYIEMGKRLYEQYREAPFEGFESEIQSINEKNELIEQLKEQIRVVKGVVLCPCCNMEVPEHERFCSNCGNKMPEVVDPEEADADAVVVDSVDVTEEAAEGSDEPEQESPAAETVEAEGEGLEASSGEAEVTKDVQPEEAAEETEPESAAEDVQPDELSGETEPEETSEEIKPE